MASKMSTGYAVVTGANAAIGRQPSISPQCQYTGGMWRIPVFIVTALAAFVGITYACVALSDAGIAWLAVTVLILGMGGFAVAIFPVLSWTVTGRWGSFYRR